MELRPLPPEDRGLAGIPAPGSTEITYDHRRAIMNPDWDAATYHQVSSTQFDWGLRVLDTLEVRGDEHALDVGCGTGRVTAVLAGRLPRGRVIGLDRSAAMLRQAARYLSGAGVPLVQAGAEQLPFVQAFDIVISTATFHWIPDHAALLTSLFATLQPGGRLHAQCGGEGNLERLRRRANALLQQAPFVSYFQDWPEPWHYANPEETAERLALAGFTDACAWLHEAPVVFPDARSYEMFTRAVCLRPYLHRLPEVLQNDFVSRITACGAQDDPPFSLDYCRLNIRARRPATDEPGGPTVTGSKVASARRRRSS